MVEFRLDAKLETKTKEKQKTMTKKLFKAFAAHIANLRQTAKEHSNMEGESSLVYDQAQECENMVVEVVKKFNSKFDEEKFRNACQPKG
mgnify:CR=1 FL=1